MKYKIPQFDLLSLGAQIFGFLVSFTIFYYYNITKTIPLFIEAKKFRNKKLKTSSAKINIINTNLNNFKKEDSNQYNFFV